MTIREKCKARMKHQRLENLRKSWSKKKKKIGEKLEKRGNQWRDLEIGHGNAIYEQNGS